MLKLYLFLVVACFATASARESQESNISDVIQLYEKALNMGSVEGITSLFAEDCVLVLQGAPTRIGKDEVAEFYQGLFQNLNFDLQFQVHEVVLMSDEWAFVRTATSGTLDIASNHSSISSEGHELFVLKKHYDGAWTIARYAGSSSK